MDPVALVSLDRMSVMDQAPRHLVSVWNPSYADDAMDAHLDVYLRQVREHDPDDEGVHPYVWWAKLRSPNRQQPLVHKDDVMAIQSQIAEGVETHLYLTDYRSLYVGHLSEITDDDILAGEFDETDRLPAYYLGAMADFWFRLEDIRRLVGDDTPAVIEELKNLRNTRYHDRPVSLYGGMVDLPLIVTRADGRSWFADEGLTDGRTWADRDAKLRGETERLSVELREDLLGPSTWEALEVGTRAFLSTGEAMFRTRREDPGFDFSGPAVEYAKAVETEANALVFPPVARLLSGANRADREVRLNEGSVDLGGLVPHQSLGTIRHMLKREEVLERAVRACFRHDADWILGELPAQLEPVREVRNPAAHGEAMGRERIGKLRRSVLGIGCEGLLVRIVRAKLRSRG